MRQYSIAEITEDMGMSFIVKGTLQTIKAHNYDDAVEKGIKQLKLRKGDVLSIIALQGKRAIVKGIGLPGRYEYEV